MMRPIRSVDDLSPVLLSALAEEVSLYTELGNLAQKFLSDLRIACEAASGLVDEGGQYHSTSTVEHCRGAVREVIGRYEQEYGVTILAPFEVGFDEGPQNFSALVRELMCGVLNTDKGTKMVNMNDLAITAAETVDFDSRFSWKVTDQIKFTTELIRKAINSGVMFNWA